MPALTKSIRIMSMAISTNRPGHRVTDISDWGSTEFFNKSVKNENIFPHVKA